MSQPEDAIHSLIEDGHIQEAMMAVTMVNLANIYEPNGWDQPAGLWTIRRSMPPAEALDQMREALHRKVQFQGMTLTPMYMPPWATGGDAIVAMLHFLRDRLPEFPAELPQDDLVGWALVNEAWSASVDEKELEAIREGSAPRASERPDRLEARIILVVDRAMVRYQMTIIREPRDETLYVDFEQGEQHIDGQVIDALAEVMAVTP